MCSFSESKYSKILNLWNFDIRKTIAHLLKQRRISYVAKRLRAISPLWSSMWPMDGVGLVEALISETNVGCALLVGYICAQEL